MILQTPLFADNPVNEIEEPSFKINTGTVTISTIDFSPNSKLVACGHTNGEITIYDVNKRQLIKTLKGHWGAVNSIDFSPDQAKLVSGGWDETIRIWDLKTSKQEKAIEGHLTDVISVAFNSDGNYIGSASVDEILLWSVQISICFSCTTFTCSKRPYSTSSPLVS